MSQSSKTYILQTENHILIVQLKDTIVYKTQANNLFYLHFFKSFSNNVLGCCKNH